MYFVVLTYICILYLILLSFPISEVSFDISHLPAVVRLRNVVAVNLFANKRLYNKFKNYF